LKSTERINKIFEALEKKEEEQKYAGCSLTELVEETGMKYQTVKEYVRLILDVQHRRHVELASTGKTRILRFCPEGIYMVFFDFALKSSMTAARSEMREENLFGCAGGRPNRAPLFW